MDKAHSEFKCLLKTLNDRRPKSDKSFDEKDFDLKSEIELILKDDRFHNSASCV